MLVAANRDITSEMGVQKIYQAVNWEMFRFRASGNFPSPPFKLLHFNDSMGREAFQLIHNIPVEVILAPGDIVYSSLESSGFTLHYTSSMIWPSEVVGGRKMPSRATLVSLVLGEARNIVESRDEYYEVTTLSQTGSAAYRIAVGDSRGAQYAEPPPGKQWRCIVGPGDYLSLIGGGTVNVSVVVTELPPIDKLIKKVMAKLSEL